MTSLQQRFDSKWVLGQSGCWLWTGAISTAGYGRFWLNGKTPYAHRVSWELYRGTIPRKLCVLHRCDNRICVYPNHLFLGTLQDNNTDCAKKNRTAKGEKHPNAKLTQADVDFIRSIKLYRGRKGKITRAELATRYGVHKTYITTVRSKWWR